MHVFTLKEEREIERRNYKRRSSLAYSQSDRARRQKLTSLLLERGDEKNILELEYLMGEGKGVNIKSKLLSFRIKER